MIKNINEIYELIGKVNIDNTLQESVRVQDPDQTYLGDFSREITTEIMTNITKNIDEMNEVEMTYSLGDFVYQKQSIEFFVFFEGMDADSQKTKLRFPISVNGEEITREVHTFPFRTTLADLVDKFTEILFNKIDDYI